jgi:hypothetical protein
MSGQLVVDHMPWLMSAVTIYMTILAGDKRPAAWLVGLANQLLWLVWIIATATWGFIPLNAALWVVYARNYAKWRAQAVPSVGLHDVFLPPGDLEKVAFENGLVRRAGETDDDFRVRILSMGRN